MFCVLGHRSQARIRDRTERERPQASQTTVAHPPHTSTHSAAVASRAERSPRVSTPSTSKPSPTSPRRHPTPQVLVSRHPGETDAEEFSRRLHISSRPSPRPTPPPASKTGMHKLYNPDTDRMHSRRAPEPEATSDTTGSSYVPTPRPHREERGAGGARQLFDFRKDDPVRFSVLARPPSSNSLRPSPAHPSKPSGDYVSASSTSSNNASQTSSVFTLSSTTDGSSASSHLFDGRPKEDDSGNNIFGKQLKRLYRTITELEAKVQQEDGNDEDEGMTGRGVVLKGKEAANADVDKEKWKKSICDHKEYGVTPSRSSSFG
jgi:protein SMG6